MMVKRIIIGIFIFTICVTGIFFINRKKPQTQKQLVFWTVQLGTFSDYIQPIIDEFETSHPDTKIVWVDIPYSEGGKRTLAAILSNNPPDLINATPDFTTLLAQKNTLYTFSREDVSQYSESIMKSLTNDGGNTYFAVPFYATTAITFYNKNLAEKAGIKELPKNYEQLYSYSKTALEKTKSYVTMPTLNENDTFLKILNKYDLANEKNINSNEAKEICESYKRLYNDGYIPKESLTQTHRDALEKYMSGQIIFYNGGANFLSMIKENAPDIYEVTDILPQITGKNGNYDYSLMTLIIPENAKNKELALEFAKLLTNDKNQLEFAKLTTIMPVNQKTLENDYFTSNDKDLSSKARVISAKQLQKTLSPVDFKEQKKLIIQVNKTIAEIILNKNNSQKLLDDLQNWWLKNK